MMSDTWRLLIDDDADGATNMAIDEALLQSVGRGQSVPCLRLYRWTPLCLSLGMSQPASDADRDRLRAYGWGLVRRLTGGRAILHTDEITYSVAFPVNHPLVSGGIVESYRRISGGLLRALASLGMDAEAKPQYPDVTGAGGKASVRPVCFEVPSKYEIAANGKKMVGSAQVRKYDGVLQHGSLPLNGDLSRICEALAFPDDASRTEAKTRVLARATTLADALQRQITWQCAADSIVEAFKDEFDVHFTASTLTADEARLAAELRSTRYAADEWTLRL
jgi:lipoate-protein ligase A